MAKQKVILCVGGDASIHDILERGFRERTPFQVVFASDQRSAREELRQPDIEWVAFVVCRSVPIDSGGSLSLRTDMSLDFNTAELIGSMRAMFSGIPIFGIRQIPFLKDCRYEWWIRGEMERLDAMMYAGCAYISSFLDVVDVIGEYFQAQNISLLEYARAL